MRRDEDAEIRRFLGAIGAIPGVHAQRVHVLKARLPSGAWLLSTAPGTPDTVTCVQSHVVWWEGKTPHGGRDEESQKVWHRAYKAAGGDVRIFRDARQAVLALADIATGPTREALLAAASNLANP